MESSSYRGCWHELSLSFLLGSLKYRGEPPYICSPTTAVYNPKAFIPHAASLGQACAHCRRFSTAATRRCLASVSVPVRLVVLSHQLPIIALVVYYTANKLMGHGLIQGRNLTFGPQTLSSITVSFPTLSSSPGQIPMLSSPFRRFPVLLHSRATRMPNPRRQRSF